MDATHRPEQWKPVPGYEGFYEVSDQGSVRSIDRTVIRSDGQRRRFKGRATKLVTTPDNRYSVRLFRANRQRIVFAHVLVLEAFVGPRPAGKEACHRNGDPSDNRVENLYWGTHSENIQDCLKHGTHTNANKTHCARGHEYTASNTYIIPSTGSRMCRICMHINMANYKERHQL